MEIKKVSNQQNMVMQQRTTIRKYDTSVKISKDEMSSILKDAMTAPSSFNLQPWRFVVVDSDKGKQLIKPYMMFNELQWETSSAVIAVFGDLQCASYADQIFSAGVENKLFTPESKEELLKIIKGYHDSFTEERLKNSIMLDCGFVSMQLMLAAKAYGYDTNPIGGYMKKELTEALGMDTSRYVPALLITIGKSVEESHDSIRFSVDEITQWK